MSPLRKKRRPYGLAVLAAALALAAPAAAQQNGAGDLQPPRVYVVSAGGTSFTAPTAPSPAVEVHVCEETSLDDASLTITLAGADVKSAFTLQGTPASECGESDLSRVYTGTIGPLADGSSTLSARICDKGEGVDGLFYTPNCTTKNQAFTYTFSGPTAEWSPAGGTYESADVPVTIQWATGTGGVALNPSSISITLNGSPVSGFTYNAGAATSTGTLHLSPGPNTAVATICNTAGTCARPATKTFTNGPLSPVITFTPGSARQSGASIAVSLTVRVTDTQIGRSTAVFLVNGEPTTAIAAVTTPPPGAGVDQQNYGGTLPLDPGETVLSLRICTVYGRCSTQEARYFRYTALHAEPVLTAAYAQDRHLPSPGELAMSAAGPSYTSLDTERGALFVYHSGAAAPTGLVQIDASDFSQDSAVRMSIRLRDSVGSWVTFTNGAQENVYRAGNGTTRLAAQFAAGEMPTGVYRYTAVVTSYFPGDSTKEASLPVRVVIVNERRSAHGFFPGWTLLGLQHLRVGADGVVITEGDGSALDFRAATCRNISGAPTPWPLGHTCQFTAPVGSFDSLSYLSGFGYTRTYPDGSQAVFHATGQMAWVRDRFGAQTTYEWTAGRVSAIVDPIGKRTTFGYNAYGVLAQVTAPNGDWVAFNHAATDPADLATIYVGVVTSVKELKDQLYYQTDANGRIDRWLQGPNVATGDLFRAWYDHAGQDTLVQTPQVATSTGMQRQSTRMRSAVSAVLPAGATTLLAPAARVTPAQAWWRVTAPDGDSTRVLLDAWGLPAKVTDGQGRTAVGVRDALGRTVKTITATGDTTRFTWDRFRVTEVLEAGGALSQYLYSTQFPHLVSTAFQADGGVTENHYGAQGQLDSAKVHYGYAVTTTRVAYDGQMRPTRVAEVHAPSRDSVVVTYLYHSGGMQNLASVTDAAGTTAFRYDSLGRVRATTDPLGARDSTVFDTNGRVKKTVDALDFVSQYRYVAEDTTYAYGFGMLERFTDPLGQQFSFSRNALGWAVSETDPRHQTRQVAYDVSGRPTQVTNRDGSMVTMAYDARGRPITRTAGGNVTTFAYDSAGLWMSVTNAASADTIRFDAQGRVVSETTVRGGRVYQVSSQYLPSGERYSVDTRRLDNGELAKQHASYTWEDGLLTEMYMGDGTVEPSAATTSFGYDGARLKSITFPGGVIATYTYASTGALSGIAYTGTASGIATVDDVAGESYGYDPMGRVTSRESNLGDTTRVFRYALNGTLTGYGADSQINADCHPDPARGMVCTPSVTWRTFAYDGAGNRTDNGAVRDSGNRVTQFGAYHYAYDAEGRVWHRSIDSATFDQVLWFNALGQVDSVYTGGWVDGHWVPGVRTRYAYDGMGRRIRKSGTDGTFVEYVYDGDNVALELDAAGAVVARYGSLPGVDQTIAMERGGHRYHYLRDYQGSVTALISTTGAVANRYRYDPWGAHEVATQTVANPYRYTGREYDEETGLYYYRARYYDPLAGRFLSEDPIGLAGGANVYAYVGNDPVNEIDPSGLQPCKRWLRRTDGVLECFMKGITVFVPRGPTAWDRTLSSRIISVGGYSGRLASEPRCMGSACYPASTPTIGPMPPGTQVRQPSPSIDARTTLICAGEAITVNSRWGLFGGLSTPLWSADVDFISAHIGTDQKVTSGVSVSVGRGPLAIAGGGLVNEIQMGRGERWTGFRFQGKSTTIGVSGGAGIGFEVELESGKFLDCTARR